MPLLESASHDSSSKHVAYNRHVADSLSARQIEVRRTLSQLIHDASTARVRREFYTQAGQLLACLPLATGEYTLATCRLNNAKAYAERHEHGAAAYELRLLYGQVAG